MTQRIKKANSSWESTWNLNVEIIKKIFGELTRLAESQRNHERTEKQQKTKSSRPYSFHLKPANNNDNYKERKAKNKETYRKQKKKNCNPNFKPMRAFAFFGGLVAILNGLCSLTAAGPAIVTAYICCCSCFCCSSNNIKYTYTYNLPRAAPRWEVVQGLWRPKLGEWTARSRRTNEATNQKKGQDVLISMYTYTCMHCVCVCVGAGTYACVLLTVSPEVKQCLFSLLSPWNPTTKNEKLLSMWIFSFSVLIQCSPILYYSLLTWLYHD